MTTDDDLFADLLYQLAGCASIILLYPICLRHPSFQRTLHHRSISPSHLPAAILPDLHLASLPISYTNDTSVLSFPNQFLPFLSISSFNSILSFRSNYPLLCLFLDYLIPLFSQSHNAFFGLLSRSFRPLNYITLLGTGAFRAPWTLYLDSPEVSQDLS